MTHFKNQHRWKLILGAALALIIAISPMAWGQIGISATSADVTLAPGGSFTDALEVINKSPNPRQFTVDVKDYDRNIEAGLVLLDPGTQPRSLAKFLAVTPLAFTLQPDQKQPIIFTIKVPADQSGPHWAAVIVSSPLPASNSQGTGSNTPGTPITIGTIEQFIVKIRQTDPTNAVNQGRLTGVQILLPEKDKPLRVVIAYENTGTTFQQPKGEVRFINARGDVAAKVDIQPFPMLPGGKIRFEIPLDRQLPSGDYEAVAIIDFGGDFLLAALARFTIP